jgi:hypothetical protein
VTLTVWLAGAAAGAVLGGFGYAHYYAPVVLPAAALLTVAVAAARPGRGRAVALVAAVLAIAPFAADHVRALAGGGDALADRSYGEQAQVWRMYEPVGALLRERARPGDRLYVTGNEAGFYWQSRLRPASPLLYEAPLTVRPELGEELRRALCGRPPRFLVLSAGAAPAAAPCLAGAGYVVVARRPPAIVVLDRGR